MLFRKKRENIKLKLKHKFKSYYKKNDQYFKVKFYAKYLDIMINGSVAEYFFKK